MGKGSIKKALQLAGSEHKYQHILIFLISITWTAMNFVLLGSTFIYMDPVFHCNQDFDKKVFEREACPQIEKCQLVEQFTLTAQLGLYCENEWARDLIQSIFGIGCIIGLFIMNLVSDTKSRRVAMIVCISIVAFGLMITLIGGWLKSIPTVIVAQFIQGFGTSSMLSLSYAFLSDYCSDNLKPRAVIIVNTAWSVSTVLLGVFYLIEMHWSFYLLFVTLAPVVTVTVLFAIYLLESPYILMLQNKKDQAMQVFQKLTTINNRSEFIPQIKQILDHQHSKNQDSQASIHNVLKLLKKPEYLRPLIIVSILRSFGSLNFFGTSFAFDVEGLGLGYNSMIAGFMEIISFFSLTVFIHKMPRRKGIAGFYFIVLLMGFLFLFDFVKENSLVATMIMSTSRIFSTISYTLIASVQTQAFTVEIQSTAVGITEAFGLVGAMCGPLIVDLSDKIGIDSIVLIAILLNFAIWPNIFLKQTLKPLPQTTNLEPLLPQNQQEDSKFQQSLLSQSTIITNNDSDTSD